MAGRGHQPEQEPSTDSYKDMMAAGVRPHKRKGKRGGGRFGSRKHGRKSSKRE